MAKQKKIVEEAPERKVWVYLGPSIRGVIQNGTIYSGSRQEVIQSLSAVIDRYPEIATLIVSDCDIITSKTKIKDGGNSLSHAFKLLAEGGKNA